jgi:DNA-binding NtrC family response regulator
MGFRILIAEPEEAWAQICVQVAKRMGHEAVSAGSSSIVRRALDGGDVDVILADEAFPGLDLPELAKRAVRRVPPVVIVLIGQQNRKSHAGAPPQGILERVLRPFSAEELRLALERGLERRTLSQENAVLRERLATRRELGALVGSSAKMQRVYELIVKVAPTRHPVLVLGESGTGKELVARAIHSFGPASQEPFVPIDCGALSPQLIESELFGHLRGAFTGANQNRTGLLAVAGKGTAFLDEIGELSIELQAKLLRALQEKEVRPVGSNQRIPLLARIIAGTNQHLEGAITRGTFRKDLFFRLNVVSIKLPPLRERKEDIPALAYHFLERFGGESGGVQGISCEALSRLMSYDWPGNVRELENCVQRAVTLGSDSEIQLHDLPSSLQYGLSGAEYRSIPTLRQVEKRAILEALEATAGDRLRAAKLLGIGKTTIYRKVKEYGLESALPPESSG